VRPSTYSIVFALLSAGAAMAQPTVARNAIFNAASSAPIGLPNSSIAQGSIFTVYGTGLGPGSSPGLAFPLNPNLGGVTVRITSGGTTVTAIPVYVGPNQINAILPGNTPTGTATLTVTYNNQTSASVPFQVVSSSFGIFAVNQAGYGPGVITNTNYQVFGLTSAEHPGDGAIIWGTGLGASSGDDGSKPPTQTDLSSLPLTVWVGTERANVLYRGRSVFTGEDQINFVIPAGVTGCYVPVAVQIGSVVSNFVTIPIAASGSVCTTGGGTDISGFAQKGTVSIGGISLSRTTTTVTLNIPGLPNTPTTTDSGFAAFSKYTFGQLSSANNPFQVSTFGTCTVFTYTGRSTGITDVIRPVFLDAGPAITVSGPKGTKQLAKSDLVAGYFATLGGGSGPTAQPLYLDAGTYTISGTGGADVPAFSTSITLPPTLTWANKDSITSVNRASGQLITWTGGDPNGTVQIVGSSTLVGTATDGSDTVGATFTCTARVSDRQFTVPAIVLLSLPPSATTGAAAFAPTGFLSVYSITSTNFTLPNIDIASVSAIVSDSKNTTYQ